MEETPQTDAHAEGEIANQEQKAPEEPEIQLEEANFPHDYLNELDSIEELAMKFNKPQKSAAILKEEYLEKTILPLVLEGLSWIIKERPNDPVEHLAMFLLKNNQKVEEVPPKPPQPEIPQKGTSK